MGKLVRCRYAYLASAPSRRTCQWTVYMAILGLWPSGDLARLIKCSGISSFAFWRTVSLGTGLRVDDLLVLCLQAANANQEHHLLSCIAGLSVIDISGVQWRGCYYSQVSWLLHWMLFNSFLEFTNKETSRRNGFFYSALTLRAKLSIYRDTASPS